MAEERTTFGRKFGPILGNFSVQYNIQCASLAVAILVCTAEGEAPLDPEPEWAKNVLMADVFAGATLGMLCMGRLGDVLGRQSAMAITHILVVAGAIGSGALHPYLGMTFFRALLGVGVGGIYPLAATAASEEADVGVDSAVNTAKAFFWQVPGQMGPYAFGYLISPVNRGLMWRLVFLLGALPALGCVYMAGTSKDSERSQAAVSHSHGLLENLRRHGRSLAGTGLSWFLFDVAFYGISLFTPAILQDIFGADLPIWKICLSTILVQSMQAPGLLLSILLVKKRWRLKTIQTLGFCVFAVAFAAFALIFTVTQEEIVRFVSLLVLNGVLGFGPNLTTYIYPTQCMPAEIRSTFHGISAAMGKAGAFGGALMFPLLKDSDGLVAVIWVQCGISVLGVLITQWLCPKCEGDAGGREAGQQLVSAAH